MRRELEVMRVMRIPPLGKLVVEISDVRYESLSEIRDEKARRVILAAIGELINFAGGQQVLLDAGVAPPPASGTPVQASLEERQAAFLDRLEAQRDALRASQAPSQQPAVPSSAPAQAGTPSAASPQPETVNVVDQINGILQKYVAADPETSERSIHVVQDSAGGIGIEVDGTYYQKPTDIEEPKIRFLIQRAVKEWNAA